MAFSQDMASLSSTVVRKHPCLLLPVPVPAAVVDLSVKVAFPLKEGQCISPFVHSFHFPSWTLNP